MSKLLYAIALSAIGISAVLAQDGPVATACRDDLAKYCAGKNHVTREARTCLEDNKAKVSDACKTALNTTGGGRGPGMGQKAK